MKKVVALSALLVFTFAAFAPGLALGQTRRGGPGSAGSSGEVSSKVIQPGAQYVPGELIVKFKGGSGAGGAGALRQRVRAVSSRVLGGTGAEVLEVPTAQLESSIRVLRESGLVDYAEPNYIRHTDAFNPDDPVYGVGDQWNMSQPYSGGGIDMPDAWEQVHSVTGNYGGDSSVVVAVIDTGVAYRNGGGYHQADDLAGTHFTSGYDFVHGDPYADDDNGHGTHVCGTVAQTTNNTKKCAGIAFDCTIMPIKVLDSSGTGSDDDIISGLEFAADHGAEVANMSLSGPEPNEALKDACDYAFGKGVVVCASSGNNNTSFVDYPAAYSSCVAVGATRRNKSRASYSNYGSALDVMAPGGDAGIPIYQETYATEGQPSSGFAVKGYFGTSMASPHVAGTCALVKAVHPTWDASQVRGAVCLSCHDLGSAGWDAQTGWGLIDAYMAVRMTQPSSTGPAITGMTPQYGTAGSSVTVTTRGTNFYNPSKLTLERAGESGVVGTGVSQAGTTRVSCHLDLSSAQPGLWDVVIEDKALRSATLQGGFSVDAANNHIWYLAEGSTNYGFETFILIQNPSTATANVSVTLMAPDGAHGPYPVTVAPTSRATMRVNDILPGTDVSARVTADQDIICERSMYWGNRIEGTDSIGVQAPSFNWYFAEGSTNNGFDTFLLIQNPNASSAYVEVTYLTPSGVVAKDPFVIDGNSRYSINIADDLPARDMSIQVVADQRVIAERSMYWDGMRGGHDSIGTNSPARHWYLAEGSTDWGFDEWVLLGNPNTTAARVQLTYQTPTGPVPQAPVTVPAQSRVTVHVNAALPNKDVSVEAESNTGIVVERSMYWNNGTGKAGHCEIGVTQPRQQCFLAEGSTAWGFDEWVLIQNPNDTACNIGIDYMTEQGLIPTTGFSMPANSRVTVHVNSQVPNLDTSTRVYSNLPIMVERAMYWNNRGAGHVSFGLNK